MGIFDKLAGIFKRKKKLLEMPSELPPLPPLPETSTAPKTFSPFGEPGEQGTKAKMDLVSAQIDSLRIQYETINERVLQIEKMVKELLDMARSS